MAKYVIDDVNKVIYVENKSISRLTDNDIKKIKNLEKLKDYTVSYQDKVKGSINEKAAGKMKPTKSTEYYLKELKDNKAAFENFKKIKDFKYTVTLKGKPKKSAGKVIVYANNYADLILSGNEQGAAELLEQLENIRIK